MNNLFILSCLVLVASIVHADYIDVYLEIAKEPLLACAKENGFTEQNVREIYDKNVKAGVDGASCLLACAFKAMGLMKDSKLVTEKLNEIVKIAHAENPEKMQHLQKAVSECTEKVKGMPDECKMAFSYVECYMDIENRRFEQNLR